MEPRIPLIREHNFAPADACDQLVFGACRPGFASKHVAPSEVDDWLSFMARKDISRVVCLLPRSEMKPYRGRANGLLRQYQDFFGESNVLHAPIRDYHLASPESLEEILAFLALSAQRDAGAVVHCAGGSGRTGHVLAAWLVAGHGFEPDQALATVRRTGRNPYEALTSGNATERELISLLESGQRRWSSESPSSQPAPMR
jgi:protein-tyrosine phosphatase